MTTTAEGVETEAQMRCLNLEGCIEVQGYLYSKPVPADEIGGLLKSLADRRSQPGHPLQSDRSASDSDSDCLSRIHE